MKPVIAALCLLAVSGCDSAEDTRHCYVCPMDKECKSQSGMVEVICETGEPIEPASPR